jgi:hypothetical protein
MPTRIPRHLVVLVAFSGVMQVTHYGDTPKGSLCGDVIVSRGPGAFSYVKSARFGALCEGRVGQENRVTNGSTA